MREHHAQRFSNQRHGARRTHDGTGARGDGKAAFDLIDLGIIDIATPVAPPETAAVGAGPEALATMPPCHHRAGHEQRRRLAR
jgi:hypothetical protein